MIEIDKIEDKTNCFKLNGEPTVTYICRIVNQMSDEIFYSLNVETKNYINNIVIQVIRKRKHVKGE